MYDVLTFYKIYRKLFSKKEYNSNSSLKMRSSNILSLIGTGLKRINRVMIRVGDSFYVLTIRRKMH